MANIQQEIWKPIQGYEGIYEISSLGRVKTLERRDCRGQYRKSILLKAASVRGYLQIQLWNNRMSRIYKIHRLVAQVFIPNPENKPQVNHKNGVKTDNNVENLEWCTSLENIHHAQRIGIRDVVGAGNPAAKLKNNEVIEIFLSKSNQRKLAEKYNISLSTVETIKGRKSWKHLTSAL